MNLRAKGARFENRVKHHLESLGWFVVRQASSAFPDLIATPPIRTKKRRANIFSGQPVILNVGRTGDFIYAIECKVTGYLHPDEAGKFTKLRKKWGIIGMLAYPEPNGNEVMLEFINPSNLPEELRPFKKHEGI